MKTKIFLPEMLAIGILIFVSVQYLNAQKAVNKFDLQSKMKHFTELAIEIPKYRKLQYKKIDIGNLNEYISDSSIKLEDWMLNPENWNITKTLVSDKSADKKITIKDWMLSPELMGSSLMNNNVSKDKNIELENWMLSPELLMTKNTCEESGDKNIELEDWMLYVSDFKK